jgi:hypothetical protein
MKKIFFFVLAIIAVSSAKAQLANTKWAGTMAVPDDVSVVLKFKTDTLLLVIKPRGVDEFVGETMTYTVKDSTITLNKISGNSPCGDDKFTVKYTIKDQQLFIKSLTDPCDARVGSWPKEPFVKVKD